MQTIELCDDNKCSVMARQREDSLPDPARYYAETTSCDQRDLSDMTAVNDKLIRIIPLLGSLLRTPPFAMNVYRTYLHVLCL